MRIIAEDPGTGKEGLPQGLWGRFRAFLGRIPPDAYIVAIVVLCSTASFGFGYLAGKEAGAKNGLIIEQLPVEAADISSNAAPSAAPEGGQYVGSRSGSKYHLPWCSGAKNISEANKIWFASKEEAEGKGYTAAANCPGI